MEDQIRSEIDRLREVAPAALRDRYQELFGREPATNHREHLIRRIAWQLQAMKDGGLSLRALGRATEIVGDADLNGRRPFARRTKKKRSDPRLPPPGTELTREYGDRVIVAKVLEDGIECEGKRFASLSAAARAMTGTRWNGLVFFGVAKRGAPTPRKTKKKGRSQIAA